MRLALAVAALLLASPALAKDITITLNDEEQRVMTSMIDAAIKSAGLPAAEAGVYLYRKITAAQAASSAPTEPAPSKKK